MIGPAGRSSSPALPAHGRPALAPYKNGGLRATKRAMLPSGTGTSDRHGVQRATSHDQAVRQGAALQYRDRKLFEPRRPRRNGGGRGGFRGHRRQDRGGHHPRGAQGNHHQRARGPWIKRKNRSPSRNTPTGGSITPAPAAMSRWKTSPRW